MEKITNASIVFLRPGTDYRTVKFIADEIQGIFEKNYQAIELNYNIYHCDAPGVLSIVKNDLINTCRFYVRDSYKLKKEFMVHDQANMQKTGEFKKYYINSYFIDPFHKSFIDLEVLAGRSNENNTWDDKLILNSMYEREHRNEVDTPIAVICVPNTYTGGNKVSYPYLSILQKIKTKIFYNHWGDGYPNTILIGYGAPSPVIIP